MEGRRGRPPHPGDVTPAEARVLDLVREGLPNAEIAIRLGISINTVRYHVSNLLAKSGARDRGELRDWRPPRRFGGRGPLGSLLWLVKPAMASAVVVASISVVTIVVLTIRSGENTPIEAEKAEPAGQAIAAIGELRRGATGLTLIENGTGRAYPVRDEVNIGRKAGKLVFLLGVLEGGELRPTAGSVVGPLSRCSGVLSEESGRYFIKGRSCDGVELVDVSLPRLLALRAESVTVTVLPCTLTRDGRLVDPPMTLAGEDGEHSC